MLPLLFQNDLTALPDHITPADLSRRPGHGWHPACPPGCTYVVVQAEEHEPQYLTRCTRNGCADAFRGEDNLVPIMQE